MKRIQIDSLLKQSFLPESKKPGEIRNLILYDLERCLGSKLNFSLEEYAKLASVGKNITIGSPEFWRKISGAIAKLTPNRFPKHAESISIILNSYVEAFPYMPNSFFSSLGQTLSENIDHLSAYYLSMSAMDLCLTDLEYSDIFRAFENKIPEKIHEMTLKEALKIFRCLELREEFGNKKPLIENLIAHTKKLKDEMSADKLEIIIRGLNRKDIYDKEIFDNFVSKITSSNYKYHQYKRYHTAIINTNRDLAHNFIEIFNERYLKELNIDERNLI